MLMASPYLSALFRQKIISVHPEMDHFRMELSAISYQHIMKYFKGLAEG